MTKVAVLIGVNEYMPGLNPLPSAERDVSALGKVLQNPDLGGFEVTQLINPDPQTMRETIETLFTNRQKDDLVLVYFSGHALKDERGRLYFATHLTRKSDQGRLIKATAVPASFIHDVMSDSRAKRQVIILDTCFAGAFAQGLLVKSDELVDVQSLLGGEGRAILTSSNSVQVSFEKQGLDLSIYTHYLVEGIETGAADLDNDGWITIDELHEYARKKVQDAMPSMRPEIYAIKEGYKILISKAPKSLLIDPKLKYKKQVEQFSVRGEISFIGRKALDNLRNKLGLSENEAVAIEDDLLRPYRERKEILNNYEQVFCQAVQQQYPLSPEIINELQGYREILGLSYDETNLVEKKITSQIEEEYRIKFQEKDSNSLRQILHLSDLHFGNLEDANRWYTQLAEDLRYELACSTLDALIVSGDIANKSIPSEYSAAQKFFEALIHEFQIQANAICIVPGNHDSNWTLGKEAYLLKWRDSYKEDLKDGHFIDLDDAIAIRNEIEYQKRFSFFNEFYKTIKGESYPLEFDKQCTIQYLEEPNLLILGLNSSWQIDHHYRSRASINQDSLSHALSEIRRKNEYKDCLKIAVWHHPLNSSSEDRIADHGFLEQLAKAGFRIAIHGHIHQAEASFYRYDHTISGRKLNIISAGTFGASTQELKPGYPWQYNLLRLEEGKLTVFTRRREEPNGAWKPDARWLQGIGQDPSSRYEINL